MQNWVLSFLLIFGLGATAQPESKNNVIVFKIKNFGVTVEGTLASPTGTIKFDPDNLMHSVFDVTISAKSINTGIDLRDNHLRKKEYLDVDKYPEIQFQSVTIMQDKKPGSWLVTGNLTIKNVTKEISFPFELRGNILSGNFSINRREFNVGGKSLSMADEVTIELNVTNQNFQ
jgi:polyisoprenoid-binding protein YceI